MRRQLGNKRGLAVESLEDRSLLSAAPLEQPLVDAPPAPTEVDIPAPQASEYTSWPDFQVPDNPFVQLANGPGDANGDGFVDGIDFLTWVENYLVPGAWTQSDGDFNGDTIVDGADYTIWADNFALPPAPIEVLALASLPASSASSDGQGDAEPEVQLASAAASTAIEMSTSGSVETHSSSGLESALTPGIASPKSTGVPMVLPTDDCTDATRAARSVAVTSVKDSATDDDSARIDATWCAVADYLAETMDAGASSADDPCWTKPAHVRR